MKHCIVLLTVLAVLPLCACRKSEPPKPFDKKVDGPPSIVSAPMSPSIAGDQTRFGGVADTSTPAPTDTGTATTGPATTGEATTGEATTAAATTAAATTDTAPATGPGEPPTTAPATPSPTTAPVPPATAPTVN